MEGDNKQKLEIINHLAQGLTQEEIAEKLGVSQGWVSKVKAEVEDAVVQLLQRGNTADRIAEQLNLPVPFVQKLVMNNLRRRKQIPTISNIMPKNDNVNKDNEIMDSRSDKSMEKEESATAKALRAILKQTRIPNETIEAIMEMYNEEPDFYEDYPQQLWNVLTGLDVKPNKANLIINRFTNMIHGPQTYPYTYQFPRIGEVNTDENPRQQPPYIYNQPYPYPVYPRTIRNIESDDDEYEKRKRERQREREEIREMILDLRMAEALKGATGGTGLYGGFGQNNPFVAVTTEPILDAQGNPVYDKYGMPLYRVYQQPIVLNPQNQNQSNTQNTSTNDFLTKLIENMQNQVGTLSEKVLEVTRQTTEKEMGELKDRINALASRDPLEELISRMDALKNAGLIPTNTSEDFQRWKFEQERDFQKWMAEREDRWKELQLSRLQMAEVTNGVKEVIGNVAGPLAKAVAEGYIEEKKQPKTQPSQNTPQTSQINLSAISNEELEKRWNQIQTAKATLEKYEREFYEELNRRRKPKVEESPNKIVDITVDAGGDR